MLWTLLIVFTHTDEPTHVAPFLQTQTLAQCQVEGKAKLDEMIRTRNNLSGGDWDNVSTRCVSTKAYDRAIAELLKTQVVDYIEGWDSPVLGEKK